ARAPDPRVGSGRRARIVGASGRPSRPLYRVADATLDDTIRAITVRTNTIAISVRAAPHARSIEALNGVCALKQISCDSFVVVPWNGFELMPVATPRVNSSAAVSPAARATASIAPLTIPGRAAGSTPEPTVRPRRAPSASLA